MATDVSICSAALMLLGDAPIATLAEPTARARLCANLYPIAKRAILRSHPWNCLVTRTVLAPLTTEPPFDWKAEFPVPGNWLRTLQVGRTGETLDYSAERGRILANTDTLPFLYLAERGEGEWDDLLVDVMVKRMEMDLAYPITKSTSLRDSLKDEFYAPGRGVLARAKNIDGQENPPDDFGDESAFIRVRG